MLFDKSAFSWFSLLPVIKEPPSPTPLAVLLFWFFYDLYTFSKNKDYFHPTTYRRSPRIFGALALQPQKSEKRSIKVLTSSPKTIKLNLQLKEEVVIIPKRLLVKGLTWSRSTLQNHCCEFDSCIPCHLNIKVAQELLFML